MFSSKKRSLIILCATTGSGQTTLLTALRDAGFYIPPVHTTRNLRTDEIVHETHLFISEADFVELYKKGEMQFVFNRAGAFYGYKKSEITITDDVKNFCVIALPSELGLLAKIHDPSIILIWLEPLSTFKVDQLLDRSLDNPLSAVTRIIARMDHLKYKSFADLVLKDVEVMTRVNDITRFIEKR